jgi:predicted ATPase
MQIVSIEIRDLRNIQNLQLDDLPRLVVLAGQNGSGKSTILEAIKIWKTLATGYYSQPQPYNQLFEAIRTGADEAVISIALNLTAQEISDVNSLPPQPQMGGHALATAVYGATIRIRRDVNVQYLEPFRDYPMVPALRYPDRSGFPNAPIFDYYGPYRMLESGAYSGFNRQLLGREVEEQSRLGPPGRLSKRDLRHFLFDIDQRLIDRITERVEQYKSSKTGGNFDLASEPDDFAELRSLLHDVLPDLSFSRVSRPSGSSGVVADFLFTVRDGKEVTVDQLSAGEKEVLALFFELFRTDPRNSIIMIDEPELHLNASIEARVLPYLARRFIDERNDQIFLATHSTGILSVTPDSSLYKIAKPDGAGSNQGSQIGSSPKRAALLRDLVGNLGVFTTAERFVFVEGESTVKSIDKRVLELLFPGLRADTVFIPAGSNSSVQSIARKVQQILSEEVPFGKFYALRDRDRLSVGEVSALEKAHRLRVLTRCMIENFLLDEVVWAHTLGALGRPHSVSDILESRRRVAEGMVSSEISSRLDHHYRSTLNQHDFRDVPSSPTEDKLRRLISATAAALAAYPNLKKELEASVIAELDGDGYLVSFDGKRLIELLKDDLEIKMPMQELLPLLAATASQMNRVPADLRRTITELLEVAP